MGAAALLAGLVSPVLAGDRAQLDLIGYSGDGAYFAFEEFGVRDGSGFAYSNIYILDLEADAWTAGSPFRVQAEDEGETLGAVREAAQGAAAPQLARLGLDTPAVIAALVGDGEMGSEGKSLKFGAPGYGQPGEVLGAFELRLRTFAAKSPEPCEDYLGEAAKGYALTLSGDGPARELHRDAELPRSRGCPLDYRIYAVVLPFETIEIDRAVAIVSVYPFGFEGPDRRFIAVPVGR